MPLTTDPVVTDVTAVAAAAPRRVSIASVSATESSAQTTAGAGTSDGEAHAPPSEPQQRPDASDGAPSGARKRTQSTGTSPPPQTIATQVSTRRFA